MASRAFACSSSCVSMDGSSWSRRAKHLVLRSRHADYYRALAEKAAPEMHGPHQRAWLACLAQEHPNLRAALELGARDPVDRVWPAAGERPMLVLATAWPCA